MDSCWPGNILDEGPDPPIGTFGMVSFKDGVCHPLKHTSRRVQLCIVGCVSVMQASAILPFTLTCVVYICVSLLMYWFAVISVVITSSLLFIN